MWIAFVIIALLLLLMFFAMFFIYKKAFYSPHKNQNNVYNLPKTKQYIEYKQKMLDLINLLVDVEYEPVEITSFDGLKLYGRYYHFCDGAPVALQMHGYRGTAVRDMCGGFQSSKKMGQNVLLIDERATGKSEGHSITFGIKERYDCVSWIEYIKKRFGEEIPILLYGVSMGATTVLMASELGIDKNVKGIIADSPYSSPYDIIKKVCAEDLGYPSKIAMPFVKMTAKLFCGFDICAKTAAEAVKNSKIPTLIIHGGGDFFVPPTMSREIVDANPNLEYVVFPEAEHGISAIIHTEEYNRLVLSFIEKCFKK